MNMSRRHLVQASFACGLVLPSLPSRAQTVGTLDTVTVYGTAGPGCDTWGDISAASSQMSNEIVHIYNVAYLLSDDAFNDFFRAFPNPYGAELFLIRWACQVHWNLVNVGGDPVDAIRYLNHNITDPNLPYSSPTQLWGGIWSALAAGGHYIYGNGTPLSIDINRVGFDLQLEEVGSAAAGTTLSGFINSLSAPGIYNYDSGAYGYSSYNDSLGAKLLIGGTVFRTQGVVQIFGDGRWEFSGQTSGFTDRFDFEPRSDRPAWAENITAFFRAIGGSSFDINITNTMLTNFRNY